MLLEEISGAGCSELLELSAARESRILASSTCLFIDATYESSGEICCAESATAESATDESGCTAESAFATGAAGTVSAGADTATEELLAMLELEGATELDCGTSELEDAATLDAGTTLLEEGATLLEDASAASASASNSANRSRGWAKDCTAHIPAKRAAKEKANLHICP